MRINFVMSNTVYSGIFYGIIKYFKKYVSSNHELFVTQFPIKNVDIYHYHRPNLEKYLLSPSIVTVHHDLEDSDPWFDASKFIEQYRCADTVVCLNTKQSNILKEQYDITNTVIIPHGVDDTIFTPKKQYNQKDKLIIGVFSRRYGRRVKGEAFMVELYKRLNVNTVEFCFVGEGRTIDMYEAKSFGFLATAYEKYPYHMYNNLYQYIDILLVPSLFEGGPANIPEALYTKTPVVGRKIAMIGDMIKEGINGYFLTGEADKDATLLNELAINKDNIFTDLIKNILDDTSHIPTWEDVVKRYIKVYQSTIKKTNKD